MWLLFVQVCCSVTAGYEICWTFIAFVFSTIWSVQSPHLRGKENSVISVSGQFCGYSPPTDAPLHPLRLKAEGHSQRLFIVDALMCGLTADMSNIKLWATSELCSEPPVSLAWLFLLSPRWRCAVWELVLSLAADRTELSLSMFITEPMSLFDTHAVTLRGTILSMITPQRYQSADDSWRWFPVFWSCNKT